MTTAYHFIGPTLRDGRPIPPDGEWLTHDGPVDLCVSGLHASEHPFDALAWAPGETLCLVECQDIVAGIDSKFVCRRRRIIQRFDAPGLLRHFARACAAFVLHQWPAPAVVGEYLSTGDAELRAYARSTARAWARGGRIGAAAWSAAWAATHEVRHAPLYDAAPSAWHAARTARAAGATLDVQRDLFARLVHDAMGAA